MLTPMELAKSKLALNAPEFVSLTARLEFVSTDKVPTAGTDGRRVFYNEDFLATLTLPQTIGLTLHEVGHNCLAHPARIGLRDKVRANWAMDIALNYNLLKYFEETRNTLNAELPPGGLFGPKFAKYDGMAWESIYADDEGWEQFKKDTGGGQWDFVEPGTNEDGTPMTPSQADALAKEWTMAAQQAATMAKARGLNSAFFESWVAGLVKTKVDWQSFIRDMAKRITKEDQSWRRFNRRMVHSGTYLPSLYSERIGLVVFAVDTSGSMADDNFKYALGGMNEILEDLRPDKIVFICCDTEVKSVEELSPDDLPVVAKSFKGRGGTVLSPIFEHIKGMDEEVEMVVVLTDGAFESNISHNLEPRCPTVWLVTTDDTQAALSAFGTVLRVEG